MIFQRSIFFTLLFFILLIPGFSQSRLITTKTQISVVAAGNLASLSGFIDSSLLNRFSPASNAVYLFAGSPTALGELGSATNAPLLVVPIKQVACVFSYEIPGLKTGAYTVAVTQNGDTDLPNSIENIKFVSKISVNIQSNAALQNQNILPLGKILRVGSGRTYAKPSQAIAASVNGDVIEIDSGLYKDDFASIGTQVTLRGVGPTRPQIQQTKGVIPNGKGIYTTTGKVIIENLEISGARVPDQNGAAVRIENDTVICNSYLFNNENGVLGDANKIRIEYTEVADNGLTDVGYTHNIYVNAGEFTLIYSYVHDAHDPLNTTDTGHNVKSRSKVNYILFNRIMNEVTGTASDQINLPQGGLTYIVGNVIRESNKSNSNRIILFYDNGSDGAANPSRDLYLINNTIVSDDGEAYLTRGTGTNVYAYNNLFWGTPPSISATTQSNNIFSNLAADFVNKAGFDFHLNSTSKAVNAGLKPSSIPNFPIQIQNEYAHKASSIIRKNDNQIDAGAFEF